MSMHRSGQTSRVPYSSIGLGPRNFNTHPQPAQSWGRWLFQKVEDVRETCRGGVWSILHALVSEPDQIILITGREVKQYESTGVTKEMIKRSMLGEETDLEMKSIRKLLESATGLDDLSGIPEETLKAAADILITSGAPELVHILLLDNAALLYKILGSKNPAQVWAGSYTDPEAVEKPRYILNALAKPGILEDLDLKLLPEMLDLPDFAEVLEVMYLMKYITIPSVGYRLSGSNEPEVYINKDPFLSPDNMDKWNILTQKEGNITEDDWMTLQGNLKDIFDSVFNEGDEGEISAKKSNLDDFFKKSMETADAESSSAGEQEVRKRVDAVVNVLAKYLEELRKPETTEVRRKQLKEMIQNSLDLMADGGTACADRTIVYLEKVEHYLKLFEHPEYAADVFANMFKFNTISAVLINPNKDENIEPYKLYVQKMNRVLGLGSTGEMLYEEFAREQGMLPLEEALPKVSAAFTAENLIGFTAGLEAFKLMFEEEKKQAIAAMHAEMDDIMDQSFDLRQAASAKYGPKGNEPNPEKMKAEMANIKAESDLKIQTVQNRIDRVESSFYENKARQLFLDSRLLKI